MSYFSTSHRKIGQPQRVSRTSRESGVSRTGATVRAATAGVIEPLESRTLMSATVNLPGPTSVLRAENITRERDGSYTFKVLYHDSDGVDLATIGRGDVTVTGPHGYSYSAKLFSVAADAASDGSLVVAKYKVAAPAGGTWDASGDGYYTVTLRANEVRDELGHPALDGVVGQFVVRTSSTSTANGNGNDVAQGVSVANFGAIPDDGIDDTAAIQAAIDSLPMSNGVPTGESPCGGIVQFETGTYKITGPIYLRGSVVLQGQGNGTVIKDFNSNRNSAAIILNCPYSHGSNVAAGVRDLQIYTYYTRAIQLGAIAGHLDDFVADGLKISSGNVAIDLRQAEVYHATLRDIVINNPGSTAVWMGKSTGDGGANNMLERVRVIGNARSGFNAGTDKGLFNLVGDTTWVGGSVEMLGATIIPIYIRGTNSMIGVWSEFSPNQCPNKTVILFEDCYYASIDRLINVDSDRRIKLIRSPNVRIGVLTIERQADVLNDCVSVDSKSHLTIDTVMAIWDSGGFDNTRVTVRSAYNKSDGSLISNDEPSVGQNLLNDPTFATFGSSDNWTVQWGNGLGTVTGTASVEQTADGPRLKVVVTSNPNNVALAIIGKFRAPLSSLGKRGVALWRIDGGGQASVWAKDYAAAYVARAVNTKTGARTPTGLKSDDAIIFVLPQAAGTYYLSKVSVVSDPV